jgi:hypothetical protein
VKPYRSDHIGHENFDQEHIEDNKHETEKGHHVGGDPHGQKFDEGIPLQFDSTSQLL